MKFKVGDHVVLHKGSRTMRVMSINQLEELGEGLYPHFLNLRTWALVAWVNRADRTFAASYPVQALRRVKASV